MAKKSVFDEPVVEKKPRKKKAPMRSRQLWTDDEEQTLVSLYEAGATYKKITKEMERSRLAIKARLAKLGLIQFDIEEAIERSKRRKQRKRAG